MRPPALIIDSRMRPLFGPARRVNVDESKCTGQVGAWLRVELGLDGASGIGEGAMNVPMGWTADTAEGPGTRGRMGSGPELLSYHRVRMEGRARRSWFLGVSLRQ